MRQLWVACAIAIGCTIVCAGAAHADGTGIVAISVTDTDRATVARAMAAALTGSTRLVEDGVGEARAAILDGAVPVARLERFRRVREQIDEGWRAFVRVQVELAASRLAVARTEAEALVAVPGGAQLYADASLRLGAVLGHLGRTQEAQAALALALALDPDRPITLAEFSPDVVTAVDAVRAQTRTSRAIRVVSEPPGAAISIDGKDVGRAPLSVDVAIGQHVVVARHALYEARAIAVDTASTPEVLVELSRDPAWSRLADGAVAGLADAGAQELTDATVRYGDFDEIALVAQTDRRGGPALLVQRCAGLPARCSAVVEVGYGDASGLAAAAREAWQTARTADLRYPPSVFADARVTGKKPDDRCKVCRSPILWGGVGAAAVITTIVVIAVVSSSRPPPTVTVDPSQF